MIARAERTRLDFGVVIASVRVVVRPPVQSRWIIDSQPKPLLSGIDHRVCIDELCIETEAMLSEVQAHRLGRDVAQALAARLLALQEERSAAVTGGQRGGPLRVELLVVRVNQPTASVTTIAEAAFESFTKRLRSGHG